jgi:hypothetical protein
VSKTLDLGSGFHVPIDILTSTVAILGIRGSGKTNTAGVIVEEATHAGIPSAVIDPTSAWWGIKSSADGKEPGLPFYVFGGEHADVPLEPEAGEIMARFAVDRRVPMVLDLGLMTKGKQLQFVGLFASTLYHKNREPLLVAIDETARFAPQNIRIKDPSASICLGAVEDLGALGRVRGLGSIIVGQRAAKINKDVLTQCHTLIVHQTNSPQDRKAIDDWIGEQYGNGPERDRFLAELPRLKRGEAFIWSPTFEIYRRVQIRPRSTFDSSKTPEIGKRATGPKVFASVDLEALTSEIFAAKERTEADDPKKLWAKIHELERLVASQSSVIVQPERVEVPVLTDNDYQRLEDAVAHLQHAARNVINQFQPSVDALVKIGEDLLEKSGLAVKWPEATSVRTPVQESTAKYVPVRTSSNGATSGLSKAERLILTVLAQYRAGGRTAVQIAILTGYAVNGGGFRNALGSLNSKGFITRGEWNIITDAGLEVLGPFEPLPTGRALLDFWIGQLSKAESLSLRAIADAYPRRISVDDVAAAAGYEAKGGGFRNALGKLRTLQLIEGRGELRASDALFERAHA